MELGGVACEVAEFAPRAARHLLVIPVINEGERIRGQLRRIAEAKLGLDVAIADGGSTDGSLEEGFLRETGVRALLTKRGPGKLSAQLRMAYAWALDEGYDGVITIDGNGKDGVEGVRLFVAALDEGCDYVQGSRYAPGGEAINTPFERWFAGRFVHAPLLSFGAGAWLTDTTNGFRGYSRRYLADPRTAPFRDVFSVYNLLFYLTVRAGALGYRIREVPVSRGYPSTGKTPTKIAGMRSKLDLLREAFDAATGAYTPEAGPRQHLFPVSAGGAAFFILLLALLLCAIWVQGAGAIDLAAIALFALASEGLGRAWLKGNFMGLAAAFPIIPWAQQRLAGPVSASDYIPLLAWIVLLLAFRSLALRLANCEQRDTVGAILAALLWLPAMFAALLL